MRHPWQIWSSFGVCLAFVVLALAWLSVQALDTDRAEAEALHQAALEENARLALWRMDSMIVPWIAQESAWPFFNAIYQHDVADQGSTEGASVSEIPLFQMEMKLLMRTDPFVLLHFQASADGRWRSPQIPTGTLREAVVPQLISEESLEEHRALLGGLRREIDVPTLLAKLPPIPDLKSVSQSMMSPATGEYLPLGTYMPERFTPRQSKSTDQQAERAKNEFQARQRLATDLTNTVNSANQANEPPLNFPPTGVGLRPDALASMPKALWIEGRLILARRARGSDQGPDHLQGCVLDWPAIKQRLVAEVADLLPSADVTSADADDVASEPRLMASLPVRVIPGDLPVVAPSGLSPIELSLWVSWAAMAAAAVAVGVLLQGVISLSERRAAFVSAVTHELRTPLTTFRMYSEMLSEGMVDNEQDRRAYLETLRVEADRLTHLVANVLAYARLERGGLGGRIETVSVDRLLEVATARLADRAAQGGFSLSVDVDEELRARQVSCDPSAVEQILFNLVDNACKYAANAENRQLQLSAAANDGVVSIRIRDNGPGVAADVRRRLFQPFRKSAQEAAQSAPGVGLGLALSRRLARSMGGDLVCESMERGACFALPLRID